MISCNPLSLPSNAHQWRRRSISTIIQALKSERRGEDNYHSTIKALNSKARIVPRKSLGQHYMLSSSINDQLSIIAGVVEGDVVLEIGPGTGSLTHVLMNAGATVIAVEKDPRMALIVKERFGCSDQLTVMVESDHCNPLQEKNVEDVKNGELREREAQTLLFLDSLDGYLLLLDSLTSTLRQAWLELASARHSMGPQRVSSTLLDLKEQFAATTVMVNELAEESLSVVQPQFILSKWACLEEKKSAPKEFVDERLPFEDRSNPQLTHRGRKHEFGTFESTTVAENVRTLSLSENSSTTSESAVVDDVNKKRYQSLCVFGALVSPKLRAAQLSFETALEIIVEIANVRSSLISSFSQLQNKQ